MIKEYRAKCLLKGKLYETLYWIYLPVKTELVYASEI